MSRVIPVSEFQPRQGPPYGQCHGMRRLPKIYCTSPEHRNKLHSSVSRLQVHKRRFTFAQTVLIEKDQLPPTPNRECEVTRVPSFETNVRR